MQKQCSYTHTHTDTYKHTYTHRDAHTHRDRERASDTNVHTRRIHRASEKATLEGLSLENLEFAKDPLSNTHTQASFGRHLLQCGGCSQGNYQIHRLKSYASFVSSQHLDLHEFFSRTFLFPTSLSLFLSLPAHLLTLRARSPSLIYYFGTESFHLPSP